jgi:Arc/MetJ family transcription regulator
MTSRKWTTGLPLGDERRVVAHLLVGFARLYVGRAVYTPGVAKHLVDIDEEALGAARAELGTNTIRDTVNEALIRAAGRRSTHVKRSLDRLARLELDDRDDAWR